MVLLFGAFRAAELGARLGADAVRMSQRAGPRGLPPPPNPAKTSEVTSGTVAGVLIFALTLPFAIGILTSGYDGHVSGTAIVRFLVATWGLMALYGIGSAVAKKRYTRSVLRNYAKPSRDTETADMRAYLAQLRAAEPSEPRPRELPAAENPEREARTQSLLSVPCPVVTCLAPARTACSMGIAIPVALMRKNPVTFCHFARMRDAVSSGAAVADDIVAMFGNNVPRGLLP